jgi:transcriptional regulator with XRE-family HTH domain
MMALNNNIGTRLKLRRKEARLTLREVAEMTGLTASFLSQVERGRVNLSLNSLQSIAKVLRVPVLYFLAEEEDSASELQEGSDEANPTDNRPAYTPVVQADLRSRLILPGTGMEMELLVPSLSRKMVSYKGRLSPGKVHLASRLREPTEQVIYMLQGTLQLELAYGTFTVTSDESIYFEGEDLIRMINASESEDSVWVAVITPPVL